MAGDRATDLGLLLLRIGLGLLFLIDSVRKFALAAEVHKAIAGSGLLPAPLAALYAAGIGWWELIFGICLLAGAATRATAGAACLALISYTIYIGAEGHYPFFGVTPSGLLDRNVALIFAALALVVAGPGAYSLDRLIFRRGRPRTDRA